MTDQGIMPGYVSAGFDPRSHLANFHNGHHQAPPPLQHHIPQDQEQSKAKNNRTNQDFLPPRNFIMPTAFPGLEASAKPFQEPTNQQPPQQQQATSSKSAGNSSNNTELWPCPSCKIPFQEAIELQNHLSIHMREEAEAAKALSCAAGCGKQFTSTERMHLHLRKVHGEKSCSCPSCAYRPPPPTYH